MLSVRRVLMASCEMPGVGTGETPLSCAKGFAVRAGQGLLRHTEPERASRSRVTVLRTELEVGRETHVKPS